MSVCQYWKLSDINLAEGAHRAFVGSDIETKRRMINFVFQNLQLNGGNLEYSLREPFDMFANAHTRSEWLC